MLAAACLICTDHYDSIRPVAAMPCGHTFHNDCLKKWLSKSRNCPSCRQSLKKSQQPIHRLYWDTEVSSSQASASSDANYVSSLKTELSGLQMEVEKLKSENENIEGQYNAMVVTVAEKDVELKKAIKSQDRMKKRLQDAAQDEKQMKNMREQIQHLKAVQVILNGVDHEVSEMLTERAGYTANQVTYIVLLRKQLEESRKTNDQLKREIADLRFQCDKAKRSVIATEKELQIAKSALQQSENQNINLRRKCDQLVKAIESPRGVACSLAKRMINESPAPTMVTPPPPSFPASTDENIIEPHTPLINSNQLDANASKCFFTGFTDGISPGLFSEDSEPELEDGDDIKQILFKDEPKAKRCKLNEDESVTGENMDSSFQSFPGKIQPKSSIAIRVKPILSLKSPGKDVTNTRHSPHHATAVQDAGPSNSKFFRKGFNGLGGQESFFSFDKRPTAPSLSIFRKRPAQKSKQGSHSQSKIDEFIYLD